MNNIVSILQGEEARRCNKCSIAKPIHEFPNEDKCKLMLLATFAFDHHHMTGLVRGLLCSMCNQSLGLVKENINTLANMIRYLQIQL